MMLKYLIQDFHLSLFQNYGSLTHETRIKDAVNMEDLICLLATVRTLNRYVDSGKFAPLFLHVYRKNKKQKQKNLLKQVLNQY